MRPFLLAWAMTSLALVSANDFEPAKAELLAEEAVKGDTPANTKEAVDYTIFNDIKVPPMKDIKGEEFAETIKDGYWWVKHYSPYCGHCNAIKPHWQTLYEFYYTESPLAGKTQQATMDFEGPNSFHGYYNFHFAEVNCIAYGDVCQKNGVQAWPTFLLFKDGKMVEKYKGGRAMEEFSGYVEEKLESIRPGSRPVKGVKVPKAGAKSVDRGATPLYAEDKSKNLDKGKEAGEKQNEKAVQTTTSELASETAKAGRKERPKAGSTPNIQGGSVPLTAESFQKLVTTSQEPWFIKFYAPWCGHCQHLAPTWSQLAREMQGRLNIGEVNCDAEPRLCKDARVSAYPTLYYFRGGERVEYEGLRGLGDLLSFTQTALDSDVKYVDAAAFRELEETEEVIFVYFFDHATTSEDFAALDRLTLSLIGHARIVKTDSEILAARFKIHTWPKLLVSRSGRPSYYTALAPKDMRDFRRVLSWMQSVWLPLVPELTATNAHEIMDHKFTVLGVLNRENPDEFKESRRELQNAAIEWMDKMTQLFQLERQEMRDSKQLRIEEAQDRNDQRALRQAKSVAISITEDTFRKQVRFAWIDGIFWERWLRSTFGVDFTHGERVIINDEESRRYWDVTETGNYITPSRVSILETLSKITSDPPKLQSKSSIGFIENIFFQIKNSWIYHPYESSAGMLAFLSIVLYVARVTGVFKGRRINVPNAWGLTGEKGKGYFHLNGNEKGLGLLGGSAPDGKAD
ncbi:hypothetical protein LTR64_001182 [Lithohypha guttulata]|uniref:uncharacterized protein n=1 Tax=Lithohypha guttulata TaxID=1690604 RepID=UPI002DDF1B14|nr:hypothetical protein LTR51_003376 [Lithohypha guttulata]